MNLSVQHPDFASPMKEPVEKETIVVLLALGNPSEALELEKHLSERFPAIMEIYRAPSGFDAMSLAMNRPRIVLLDQRLPDVMGLDMIDPIRDQIGPDNYLIFIGGSGKSGMRPGMRDEALKRGASAICERPIHTDWLTTMVGQLLFPEIPDHPHLHGLELLDLIQMFNQKRCDRTMRIFANDGRVGSIYMNKGEITHVEAGGMQGFAAILDLMRWTEGRIVVYDALLSSERTNDIPTMHLIMDAARIMDEDDSTPGPQNALEAMPDIGFDGTPVPVSSRGATPPPVASGGGDHRRPMGGNSEDTLSLPAFDLDLDFD
ncbi:MAG: response regulator [Candidatus Sumerlaeia bacterium]|nr:response regulator [Candidatus Sumerlaeia bacterium]